MTGHGTIHGFVRSAHPGARGLKRSTFYLERGEGGAILRAGSKEAPKTPSMNWPVSMGPMPRASKRSLGTQIGVAVFPLRFWPRIESSGDLGMFASRIRAVWPDSRPFYPI